LHARKVKQALNFSAAVNMDRFKAQSTALLRKFLFHTNLNLQAKDHFTHLQKVRSKIAEMYRSHVRALENRAGVLSEVFDYEIGYLVKFFGKKRKGPGNKKNNRLVVKLNSISKAVKRRVLELYMSRMKFYFTVKTLKWFLLFRSDNYEELEEVSVKSYSH